MSLDAEWDRAMRLCADIAAHPLHPSLDCTEVVEVFLRAVPSGHMAYLHAQGTHPQFFEVWERGHWRPFVYHAVFILRGWVFDPYWSAHPIAQAQYFAALQEHNAHIPLQWDTTLPPGYVQ
ncbi:hypothetical protein [Sulfobacillus thermosulfidooxidans]|uniref:hypothetical protein n=1 Tax=Sulfobacillus thermosulfidooxidans TaxID=28034 RepID=UPI0006B409DC|nr:hypothetical protein [Sulfobacillus thermosulfidooxidans]